MVPPAPASNCRLHDVDVLVFGSSKRKDRWLELKMAGVPGWTGPGAASKVEKPLMAHCWLMHEAVELSFVVRGWARTIGSAAARGRRSVEKCMMVCN